MQEDVKPPAGIDEATRAELWMASTRHKLRSSRPPPSDVEVEIIDLVSSDDEEAGQEQGSEPHNPNEGDISGTDIPPADERGETSAHRPDAAVVGSASPENSDNETEKTDSSSSEEEEEDEEEGDEVAPTEPEDSQIPEEVEEKKKESGPESVANDDANDEPFSSDSEEEEEGASSDDEVSASDSDLLAEEEKDAEDEGLFIGGSKYKRAHGRAALRKFRTKTAGRGGLVKRKRPEEATTRTLKRKRGATGAFIDGGVNHSNGNNGTPKHQADLRNYFSPVRDSGELDRIMNEGVAAAAAGRGSPLLTPAAAVRSGAGPEMAGKTSRPTFDLPLTQQPGPLGDACRVLEDVFRNDPESSDQFLSWVVSRHREEIMEKVAPELERRNATHVAAIFEKGIQSVKDKFVETVLEIPEIKQIFEATDQSNQHGDGVVRSPEDRNACNEATTNAFYAAPSPSRTHPKTRNGRITRAGIFTALETGTPIASSRKSRLPTARKSSSPLKNGRVYPGPVLDSAVSSFQSTLAVVAEAIQEGYNPLPEQQEKFEAIYKEASQLICDGNAVPLAPRVFAEGHHANLWPGFSYFEKSFWGGVEVACLDDATVAEFRNRNFELPEGMERVLRGGAGYTLLITHNFITEGKGWGLRALQNIPAGACVLCYHGEYLTEDQENQRRLGVDPNAKGCSSEVDLNGPPLKACYSFTLDGASAPAAAVRRDSKQLETTIELGEGAEPGWCNLSCYVVDSRFKGNASRFINHSCVPNLTSREVNVPYGPTIVLQFAVRDIKRGEELTLDYAEGWTKEQKMEAKKSWQREEAHQVCKCGEPKCRKWTF